MEPQVRDGGGARGGGNRGNADGGVVDEAEVDCANARQVEDDVQSLNRQVDCTGVELAQEAEADWSSTGVGEVRSVEGADDFTECAGAAEGMANSEREQAGEKVQKQQKVSYVVDDGSSEAFGVRCSHEV